MQYLYLSIAFLLNASANILLKLQSEKGFVFKGLKWYELITNNWIFLTGIFLFAINVVFYFLALKNIQLSVAYPVMVIMSFLLINSYAFFFIGEKINFMQFIGYILLIIGILLIFNFAKE